MPRQVAAAKVRGIRGRAMRRRQQNKFRSRSLARRIRIRDAVRVSRAHVASLIGSRRKLDGAAPPDLDFGANKRRTIRLIARLRYRLREKRNLCLAGRCFLPPQRVLTLSGPQRESQSDKKFF
jgi:hypothetical protein